MSSTLCHRLGRARGLVVVATFLGCAAPLRADDPYGVSRSTVGFTRLKVTNDREVHQNEADGASYPEETFRVLAYNLFMLPTDLCAVGLDACRAGSAAKWQLVDDVIAETEAVDGAYDVLVLSELWKYGVWGHGLDIDPEYGLSGVQGAGYSWARTLNNGFGIVQTQLWERGYVYQTGAPGASNQYHEDGGVFIASKWPIVYTDNFVFTDCNGSVLTHIFGGGTSDCSARKGVVYAKVQKSASRVYHVFATHMQASAFNSDGSRHADWPDYVAVRASQLAEFANFVNTLTNDGRIAPDELVILAGDFNINSTDAEHADLLTVLNAVEPPLTSRTGRLFTGNDQATNDLAPVLGGPEPPSLIDYVLFSNLHRVPVNPRQVIRPMRTATQWANGNTLHYDLSDHHAVLGGFTWSHLSDSGQPRVALATATRDTLDGRVWPAATPFTRASFTKLLAGDFNGDGKADFVHIDTPAPGAASAVKAVRAALSNGTSGFTAGNWAQWNANHAFRYLTGDFNGDKKTDLLRIETPATGDGWRSFLVSLSNGSNAFGSSSWGANLVGANDLVFTGDFTGDGRSDVLQVQVPPAGAGWAPRNLILARNFAGNGTNTFGDWNAAGVSWWTSATDMEMLVGDFNGDGKTDVLKIDLPSSGCANLGFWVGTSYQEAGTGFFKFAVQGDHPNGEWTRPLNCRNSKYFTGDFDADGRTDVAWVRFDSGDPEAVAPRAVYTALARPSSVPGKWFFYVIKSPYTVPASVYTKFLAADFDGDGTTDLLRLTAPDRGRNRGCMAMRMSYARGDRTGTFEEENGNVFNEGTASGCADSGSSYFWATYKQLKMLSGDFNFDGRTDVVFFDVPTI